MMGDIITDLASVLQGGMGFASGGNIGAEHAMFEPVHGSAPKYAGKNEVNPFATFFAIEQMLRWLARPERGLPAPRLRRPIRTGRRRRPSSGPGRQTYDQGGTVTTSGAGDLLSEALRSEAQ